MSSDSWQSMVNTLRMRLQFEPVIDDSVADQIADEIVARPFGGRSVQDNFDAILEAAHNRGPMPHLVPSNHTDAELRSFLNRLAQRLDDLRPWPNPPYRAVTLSAAADVSAMAPVALLTEYQLTVQNNLQELFRDIDVAGEPRGVLVLELNTGAMVVLLGPADLRDPRVLLLGSHRHDPGSTVADFHAATNFPVNLVKVLDAHEVATLGRPLRDSSAPL